MKTLKKIFLIAVLCLIAYVLLPAKVKYHFTITEYEILITQIEKFEQHNGRLPEEDEFNKIKIELGYWQNEYCPCYNKESENQYLLWFGAELGESITYNSKTKSWKF